MNTRTHRCVCFCAEQDARVFNGFALSGHLSPVLARHSKSFSLVSAISVGVGRMQRNFEPMRKQVQLWYQSDVSADASGLEIISAQ
jgi:hypothetical protein